MNVLNQVVTDKYAIYHADSCEALPMLPSNSIGYSIFSPPFASLYTYSASERDLGNVKNSDEFFRHFAFMIPEIFRVLKPGRLVSLHCMELPTSKSMHGHIGLQDFPGDIIRAFQSAGFIFHSRVTIWKDPVTAMQRTKALGLLHKTIRKDSAMSRQGIPDYLVTMRKPGVNEEPIAHTAEEFPVQMWQRYASPVWVTTEGHDMDGWPICKQDIDPSDTLQYRSAREHDDERHICPLQLEVIRRGVRLWSNPGDAVLSPFSGIGSEGHVSLQEGRKYVGIELKKSYYEQSTRNLEAAASETEDQLSMFGDL